MKKIIYVIILLGFPRFFAMADNSVGLFGEVEFSLDNGLKVIFIEDRRIPIIYNGIAYKVGSVDEPNGKTGMAHMLEHMLFKGNEKESGKKFDAFLESVGGYQNGSTNRNSTYYYQVAPSNHLERLIAWESERMRNAVFNDEMLKIEKNIVFQERRMRLESSPESRFYNKIRIDGYGKNNYSRSVIGEVKDLKSQNFKDLRAFYDKYYQPNNAVVFIAGNASLSDVKRLVNKYYGKYKKSEKIQRVFTKKLKVNPIKKIYKDKNVSNETWVKYTNLDYAANKNIDSEIKQYLALQLAFSSLFNKAYAPFQKKYVEAGVLKYFNASLNYNKSHMTIFFDTQSAGKNHIKIKVINKFIAKAGSLMTAEDINKEKISVLNYLPLLRDNSLRTINVISNDFLDTHTLNTISREKLRTLLNEIDVTYVKSVYKKLVVKKKFFSGLLERS